MDFYFHAFRDLQTCANMNGQIPWVAAKQYADTYGMNVEEFQDMWSKVRFLEDSIKKANEEVKDMLPKKEAGKTKPDIET